MGLAKEQAIQESDVTAQAMAVWRELLALADKETSPLLHRDKFVLNKDAYARLGDDDISDDVPFASYTYSEVTGDESLDFSLYLNRGHFLFMIGPVEMAYMYGGFAFDATEVMVKEPEELIGADPGRIAQNIMTTLKLLLNGQISMGCNFHNGGLVALELFLLGYTTKPLGIYFQHKYPLFVREADTYLLKQNHVLRDKVKLAKSFPLVPPTLHGEQVHRGRDVTSVAELEPLTKRQADEIDQAVTMHELAGVEKGKALWWQLYGTVDFWMIAVIYGAVLWLIHDKPQFKWVFEAGTGYSATGVLGVLVVSFFTGISLVFRQNSINRGDLPLRYRLERRIYEFGAWRIAMAALGLLTAVALVVFPFWTLRGDTSGVYTLYQIAAQVPVLLVLPLGYFIAAIVALYRHRASVWGGLVFAIALYVGLFVINGIFMNTADNAPQPPDASFLIIVLPLLMIVGYVIPVVRHCSPKKDSKRTT